MNQGKYVFAQITEFLPRRTFNRYVKKYGGNKYVKHFKCWNPLLCMIFEQLTNRNSFRDLIVAINAHRGKSYHLGFVKKITLSNLFKANLNHDSRIFDEFGYYLIGIAPKDRANKDFQI
jgi:hypothetical protein